MNIERLPVHVASVGMGLPSLRLAVVEVSAAWDGSGSKGVLGICDADEDTLTLAWQAGTEAMAAAGVDPSEVSGLWWGTSRPPFAEGPSHAFLAASLGLGRDTGGALLAGSPHAGMEALASAWDAVSAGHTPLALVVASDALTPGLGTSSETATGAGAAAFLLTPPARSAPARLNRLSTRTAPVVDRYRADGAEAIGDVYDPRLFREEIFLPLLAEAANEVVAANGSRAAPSVAAPSVAAAPAVWAVSDPDGRLAPALAKRLAAQLASAEVQACIGDSGAAAPLLGFVAACATADAPMTVGIAGYGGGRATAVLAEVTKTVPGAAGTGERLRAGSKIGYTKALRARGQLDPMAEPIQMGLPPAGAAFARGNLEMLLLEGARCRSCGTISTPPSVHPACIGCGGSDLHTVRLARSGTVATFVVNQTMPPPFAAPLPMVVVDLHDGARVMVQGTPTDAEHLQVGDPVTLSLRRYALERGIPVYGYKASRTRKAAPGVAGEQRVARAGHEEVRP